MALTLTKEDGSGLSNANSYASAADGDSYHDGHLYSSDWTSATSAQKEAALVMASRLIDACYQFNGFKNDTAQAMQWPRQRCVDPDRANAFRTALSNNYGPYFPNDAVPQAVIDATCEFARELIKADSSDATDAEGVHQVSIGGSVFVQFDKKDQQPTVSPTAQIFLQKLGQYLPGRSSVAKLIRV